jgi:S-DNA-T family DNA segregation ATPase FtsK/SpoIIIE
MAKNTYKTNSNKKSRKGRRLSLSFKFLKDRRFHLSIGLFLLVACFFLLTSFLSYLFTGAADQSVVEALLETGVKQSGADTTNWFGLLGAVSAHYFIYRWFGIAALLIPPLLFILGYYIIFRKELISLRRSLVFVLFFLLWISTVFGYITLEESGYSSFSLLAGGIGYEIATLLNGLMGWGTFLFLIFSLLVFLIFFFNITQMFPPSGDQAQTAKPNAAKAQGLADTPQPANEEAEAEEPAEADDTLARDWVVADTQKKNTKPKDEPLELDIEAPSAPQTDDEASLEEEPPFAVDQFANVERNVDKLENYDPTLDLRDYKFPTLDLLNEYDEGNVQVTKEELEQNKDKIVETLINFKIGISSIKATIGPTVTLYEIVPDAGVKISRIKNLEDDIALSLAALGIRIIAPIPGKGTIGIEVPNKNREMVSVRSVLATLKFQKNTHELPVILGKTISNEVYIADLAKMPHLLMAGATGQGKSVGINLLIASLLYKRHPSQLKFVLVDPKKVELTLYNKLERHYLAMLPDSEEAIITDNKKVIHTLNSLCIEMDNRLLLLKKAGCRNLKEYNTKFVKRQLNPEKGHRYLPYIVLIIDELADLMVTAGKEIETPTSRLAAVSRATGIHLVLATQRPSVNVITGIIKANFPARLSYRVTSKIDSRTILDAGGAEQLVGMGDMLYSHGSELARLQGPFIDTAEVEKLCEYIGDQRGYESAYLLPEYSDDSQDEPGAVDLADRDAMFDEAARLIVRHQQGSTSLIQRKLKLGYNRAGRLIDQLEAAGIVGPFEGSKAREVLVQDEYSLEQILNEIEQKF